MESSRIHGVYFALAAYIFWGVVPVYFKWVQHVSAWEILAQRVVWALVLLLIILAVTGQLRHARINRHQLPRLLLTSLLLSANWLLFIYAIVNNNILEASLGYFINPLVSVFLGVIVLKESLRPLQWVAIGIAFTGICTQFVVYDSVPWLALALAFSFGLYGLFRKNLNLHAIGGLAVETMIITPFGLLYLVYLGYQGTLAFGMDDIPTDLLLMLGGFVTSFPLLCFAAAVTQLPLTVMGMLQYIAPTISMLIAVFFYDEVFGLSRLITFIAIWLALVIYTAESWWHYQRQRLPVSTP